MTDERTKCGRCGRSLAQQNYRMWCPVCQAPAFTLTFTPPQAPSISVHDWFVEWLESKTGTLRPSTIHSCRAAIEKHIFPRIGNLTLSDLTEDRVNAIVADIRATPLPGLGRNYSALSARQVENLLMRALVASEDVTA